MDVFTIIFIAIGLSMDSLAVSVASGVCLQRYKFAEAGKIAFVLALFQGVMPFLGWLAGLEFKNAFVQWDHWIAFTLLAFLGIRMIYEGLQKDNRCCFNPLKPRTLLTMALGTSIDALAVGLSFGLLDFPIVWSMIIIGVTTFIFSLFGVYAGSKMKFKKLKIEVVGGIILIMIGVKILLEHLPATL